MTDRDPAIEAAQRAWLKRYGPEMTAKYFVPSDDVDDVAKFVTDAAREALKPIRERYEELRSGTGDVALFFEDLEKLIYPESEPT